MKVEPITVINIDDVPVAVDGCSDEVKQLVELYNGWRVKEAEVRDNLLLNQAAMRDISREIVLTVRKDKEAAEAAAAEADAALESDVVDADVADAETVVE